MSFLNARSKDRAIGWTSKRHNCKPYLKSCIACGCLASLSLLHTGLYAQVPSGEAVHRVDRQVLLAAMQLEQQKGYAITATTNGGRFQGNVILQLVRWTLSPATEGSLSMTDEALPLFIDHEDNYWAYLQVTGLSPEEAPTFVNLAHQYGQDQLIEYRPGRVIQAVEEGPQPELAISVKAWWPDTVGAPSNFSYRDTLSRPQLKVTNARVVTYKLLDFGDMLFYDAIDGVYGRPVTGLLGLLFDLIGSGRAVESRIAISDDGLQIIRARAKKGFIVVKTTATIQPDGQAKKGIPNDRRDLQEIEERLLQRLEISYVPTDS